MKNYRTPLFLYLLFIGTSLFAQEAEVKIEVTPVSGKVYMLTGRGGNIGLLAGAEKTLVVDDQFANLSEKILNAIKTVSDKPVSYLLNTHWHGDHTGGNSNFAKTGAVIASHQNVRERLANAQKEKNQNDPDALPEITFADGLNFYFDDEQIMFFHSHAGHTDGDAMVYFVNSNVLHTGDLFFNGRYPYIDLNSGGSARGYIKAVENALKIINNDTKIIPGHGNLATKKDYESFLEMLKYLEANVKEALAAGKTESEIVSDEKITEKYDALNFGSGFINSERIRQIFYTSLSQN